MLACEYFKHEIQEILDKDALEVYGELARDWIEDDDAVKAKAAAYYEYVVAHD